MTRPPKKPHLFVFLVSWREEVVQQKSVATVDTEAQTEEREYPSSTLSLPWRFAGVSVASAHHRARVCLASGAEWVGGAGVDSPFNPLSWLFGVGAFFGASPLDDLMIRFHDQRQQSVNWIQAGFYLDSNILHFFLDFKDR